MTIDYEKLKGRPFPDMLRHYTSADAVRFARGFGAGHRDATGHDPFADTSAAQALPMIAVPLADGEFWQQQADTGIVWQKIVHAEESLTVHQPLPAAGTVVVSQHISEIYDRGADKGAVMVQQQFLHDDKGSLLATIDVTTLLRGNGGFGGKPYVPVRLKIPDNRTPDKVIEIQTPAEEDAVFRLSSDIKIASDSSNRKSMMRGVGCFGTAGRGVLQLVCGNRPQAFKRMGVRYVGPMFADETMRIELWQVAPGKAVFRMSACERGALVLDSSYVEFEA